MWRRTFLCYNPKRYKMLGSIVVAVITVSLLFVGAYLGNSQRADTTVTDKTEPYNEGFFGSLDTLAGGLEQFAERGKETREDRYQEYLKTQERIAGTSELLEPTPDITSPKPATQQVKVVTPPKTSETSPSSQNQVIAVPTLSQVAPKPVVTEPEPKPESKPKPAPQSPVSSIPPPSSVGANDLSSKLEDYLSGFDLLDEDFSYDESLD